MLMQSRCNISMERKVYSLAELRRRLGWAEHSVRHARLAGLRLVVFGRQKYCLGEDVLAFFRRLAERQTDSGSIPGEGE